MSNSSNTQSEEIKRAIEISKQKVERYLKEEEAVGQRMEKLNQTGAWMNMSSEELLAALQPSDSKVMDSETDS